MKRRNSCGPPPPVLLVKAALISSRALVVLAAAKTVTIPFFSDERVPQPVRAAIRTSRQGMRVGWFMEVLIWEQP